MLTLTLRALERDGLVTRTVLPTIPPRVDYELTKLGRSLLEPVSELGSWARKNRPAIAQARAAVRRGAGEVRGGRVVVRRRLTGFRPFPTARACPEERRARQRGVAADA